MAYGYAPPRDPTEVIGRRIFAYLIDVVAVAVLGAILLGTAKHSTYTNAPSDACSILRAQRNNIMCVKLGSRAYVWERGALLRSYGLAALLGVLDLVVLQSATGASLGKLCLGLRVVDQQGNKAGFGRMLARWLLLIVVDAPLCFLVGLITVLVTHPHRRVGDLAAGTFVVSKSSVGQPILVAPPVPAGYGPPPGWQPGGYGAPPSWTPPGAPAPPQWGAAPPPPASAPQWGAAPPPPPPPPPAPPAAAPPPKWGAPPSAPQWTQPPPPATPWTEPPPPAPTPPAPPAAPQEGGEQPRFEAWWDQALPPDQPAPPRDEPAPSQEEPAPPPDEHGSDGGRT